MYLKRLEIHGFKSFADRVRFDFKPGVTGIVGPNGCGKSNVVDATKWVLGEQSAKSLRGHEMTDVIFNGCATRGRVNFAEVELTFDNTSRRLPLPVDDVAVKRRLYRDGISEYYINGRRALLRQIRDLFLDTGIGTSTYSIIEQGRIASFIEAGIKDRRQIFEEAAGISRYKLARKRTQRSLERVQVNLDRLEDVVREVSERLKKVERQASRARRYRDIQEQLKDKRLALALADYHVLAEKFTNAGNTVKDAAEKEGLIEAQLATVQAGIVEGETGVEDLDEHLAEADRALADAQEAVVELEQKVKYNGRMVEELEGAEQRSAAEAAAAETRHSEADAERDGALDDCAGLAIRREILQRRIDSLNKELNTAREKLEHFLADQSELRQRFQEELHRRTQLHNELLSIETELQLVGARRERAESDRTEAIAELAAAEQDSATHRDWLKELRARAEAHRRAAELLAGFIEELEARRLRLLELRGKFGRELESARASAATIRDMITRHEGMGRGVRAVLDAARTPAGESFDAVGVVADIVNVAPGMERAVETALGAALQNIVVRTATGAKAAIAYLNTERLGRVTFLPLDRIRPGRRLPGKLVSAPGCLGVAVELVEYPAELKVVFAFLLGRTLVFETLESAVAATRSGQDGWRLVTLNGEMLYPGGAIAGGRERSNPVRFLGRRNEVEALEKRAAELAERLESVGTQLETEQHRLAAAADEKRRAEQETGETATEAARVEELLRLAENNAKTASSRLELLDAELRSFDEARREAEAQAADKRGDLEKIDEEHRNLDVDIRQLDDEIGELAQAKAGWEAGLSEARIELTQVAEQLRGRRERFHASARLVADTERIAAEHREEARRCAARREQLRKEITGHRSALADLLSKREELIDARREIDEKRRGGKEKIQENRSRERELRAKLATANDELNRARSREGEFRVRLETLVEKMRQVGLELEEEYRALDGQPPEISDELREEVAAFERKLRNIGNVSMYAIEEYDELSKRHEFLVIQQQDLTHARDQLRRIVGTINTRSRKLFIETFDQVRENFRRMFHKLFNGGKADVILEEGADVLEAGIEIIARPPGKDPAALSQLSGGEQAKVTLALLFSIYQLKPAPFCILDEVDAPLDEANIDRFNLILREFLDHSQFVVITHNKKTMSYSDTIFGVVMEEKGVSKKISVTFKDLEEQEALAMAGD